MPQAFSKDFEAYWLLADNYFGSIEHWQAMRIKKAAHKAWIAGKKIASTRLAKEGRKNG